MKKRGKTFKEIYMEKRKLPTPAAEFVKEIAEKTKRSEFTVRAWLSGTQEPDKLAKSVLAETLGVSPEDLFPYPEHLKICNYDNSDRATD